MHTIGRHSPDFIKTVDPTAVRHLILTLGYLILHDAERAPRLDACQRKLAEVLGEAVAAGGFPQMSNVSFDDVRFAYEVAIDLNRRACHWSSDHSGGPGYNFWSDLSSTMVHRRTELVRAGQ